MKTFDARTLAHWRGWLEKHHASEREIWLVFHKPHTGVPCVSYKDALDEALCFGWIDSLVKRIDEDRYGRKFTPRKPDSKWSAINRKRYAELQAAGRLQPSGVARPPTDRVAVKPNISVPSKAPDDMQKALKQNPAAWRYFESLAPSHKRHYIGWIVMAKQEETRARRLAEAVRLLASGQKLGLK
jgi:uncharacterized protein YdeI (YjbR/CyaY-like superfamily)